MVAVIWGLFKASVFGGMPHLFVPNAQELLLETIDALRFDSTASGVS